MSDAGGKIHGMESIFYLLIGITLGAGATWGIFFVSRSRSGSAELAAANAIVIELRKRLSDTEVSLAYEREREAEEKSLVDQFGPLKDELEKLKTQVAQREESNNNAFSAIAEQLRSAATTNAEFKNQAAALANAMAKPGGKGSWGELTLERLVESLGMIPEVDFLKKEKLAADEENENGKRRLPDLVIWMPKKRFVAVDSKVPYTNYLAAMDAEDEVTDGNYSKRDELLEKYIQDVRIQISNLSDKKYYTGLESSPEFTVLYMPNEPALAVATRLDPKLLEFAFSKRIVLVTPSTFFTVLKTVSHIWSKSEDENTASKVLDLGQRIMQQVRLLAVDVVAVRKGIRDAADGFNAMTKRMNEGFVNAARDVAHHPALAQKAAGTPEIHELGIQLNDLTAEEYKELPPGQLE
ncbi:MAG: hypothetical protein RL101_739 [Actinomycetota bacterium]